MEWTKYFTRTHNTLQEHITKINRNIKEGDYMLNIYLILKDVSEGLSESNKCTYKIISLFVGL